MSARPLLVELFVEELPPKALKALGEAFAGALAASLKAQGLAAADAVATVFASPRRLGLHLSAVGEKAEDRPLRQKLMPVAVGLDAEGRPTPALLKKLAALGIAASPLPGFERALDGKAEALFLDTRVPGATLAEGLQRALDEAIAKLPIPKLMSYQLEGEPGPGLDPGWTTVQFVRPAHGLVALHGDAVVPVKALGLTAGRTTQGHRFEAARQPVVLHDAGSYAAQLAEEGAVIAGFEARRNEIARQLQAAAAGVGGTPVDDPALLDEVTALVERPNVLVCAFEPEFLAVPQECLILTMKANQKYFPLLDAEGTLTHRFLVVANIRPADASAVTGGNERVVRPRLADAKFFYDQDRKKTLASRGPSLDKVVYHAKLGSMGDRVRRVAQIAEGLGRALDDPALGAHAAEAARLAKADLLTDMVGEFPELQGTMGRYYAQAEGLGDDLAYAIEDHYRPRFAGDALPRGEVGVVLALADKLETLAGLFGIGQAPSGDRDPFALRRHALGVIRLLTERRLRLGLDTAVSIALDALGPLVADRKKTLADVLDFVRARQAVGLRDDGYSAQQVEAVLARPATYLLDVPARADAVRAFAALPEAPSLAAANKRVANILAKSEGAQAQPVDPKRLEEREEVDLHKALRTIGAKADAAFERADYTASLQVLAALKAPVDAFFDRVMVNADDPALRANRLGLLAALHATMNRVADLSRLAA